MTSARTEILTANTNGAMNHIFKLIHSHPGTSAAMGFGLGAAAVHHYHRRKGGDAQVEQQVSRAEVQPQLQRAPMAPNMAGLNNQSSAYIQMEGAGYDSPSMAQQQIMVSQADLGPAPMQAPYRQAQVGSMQDARYRPSNDRMNNMISINEF